MSVKRLTWLKRLVRRNRGNRLPGRGEKHCEVVTKWWHFYLVWRVRIGFRVLCYGPPGALPGEHVYYDQEREPESKVKRRVTDPLTLKMPPLPSESKVLAKFPLLCEFITSRAYDDGSDRSPGELRIRPGVVDFEGTLYDVDAGQRCSIRAKTIDDLLAGLNLLAGASDAPWETDNYLTKLLATKTKKKK